MFFRRYQTAGGYQTTLEVCLVNCLISVEISRERESARAQEGHVLMYGPTGSILKKTKVLQVVKYRKAPVPTKATLISQLLTEGSGSALHNVKVKLNSLTNLNLAPSKVDESLLEM